MTITEIFKNNEVETIRNTINNMPVEGCVDKFISYINNIQDNSKDFSTIEYHFGKRVLDDYEKLLINIIIKERYIDKSKDKLIEEIKQLYMEGIYGITDKCYDEMNDELKYYDNALCHPVIKEYLTKCLDDVLTELRETGKNKKKLQLETDIANARKLIERTESNLNQLEKELQEIENQKTEWRF